MGMMTSWSSTFELVNTLKCEIPIMFLCGLQRHVLLFVENLAPPAPKYLSRFNVFT
jgi:hypothetical protein